MKNSRLCIITFTLVSLFSLTACNAKESSENNKGVGSSNTNGLNAQEILKNMSLDEKLMILSGSPGRPVNLKSDSRGVAGYVNGVLNNNVNLPALKLADGPAGVRLNRTTTAWPIGTLLASTWDRDLVQEVGEAMGNEALEYGVDMLLAPGMNIQRNPLAGRNFEYYSEDPLLTGKIGASMVNGIQSMGVGATIKHFYGNESETNRNYIIVLADPRTSREIYLKGFEIAVKESDPWAVMTSYNLVNGVYTNQREDLLEGILRGEWGFNGLVMSDWYAGNIQRDPNSAANQISAGNDLIMPGSVFSQLKNSYSNGNLSIEAIDRSALRIINIALKTPSGLGYVPSGKVNSNEHAQLARKVGAEGMILLKNQGGSLPLKSDSSVGVFGIGQFVTYKGGSGSGNVSSEYIVDIATGLKEQLNVNTTLMDYYKEYVDQTKTSVQDGFAGIPIYSAEEAVVSKDSNLNQLLLESANSDSSAIIVISREAGEGIDRYAGKGYYYLDDSELELISRVSSEFKSRGKTVSVILNVDGVVDTEEWSEKVDSILLAYMGGQEIGNQVADIISGRVNPSGKLTQTFPKNYKDNPSSTVFPGIDANGDRYPDYMLNNEGIYVGYRYYETFDVEVSYPFGFGLSYTEFEFNNSSIISDTLESGKDGLLSFKTTIKNSGEVAGKEVAQLYVESPEVKLDKPRLELKAFNKTGLLQPGESQDLELEVSLWELASFDSERSMWILEPGEYNFYISDSSNVSGVISNTVVIDKEIIVEESSESLLLPEGITKADFVNIVK